MGRFTQIIGVIALISLAYSIAHAKQEQVKPERPTAPTMRQIPATTPCSRDDQPFVILFWVAGKDGKLVLVGRRVVVGKC